MKVLTGSPRKGSSESIHPPAGTYYRSEPIEQRQEAVLSGLRPPRQQAFGGQAVQALDGLWLLLFVCQKVVFEALKTHG